MRRTIRLKQRTLLLALLILVGGGVFLGGHRVAAATPTSFSIESIGSQIGVGDFDLKQTLINIIKWALGILAFTGVVYMMYGGFLWLTSRGDEKKIEKAKQTILQAAIGLVIVLLAWAIVLFVIRTTAGVTTNTPVAVACVPGPGICCGLACPGGPTNTFDIVAVNTCAAVPVWQDVPRSSAVSFTFNDRLRKIPNNQPLSTPYVPADDPIKLAVDNGDLIIEQCNQNAGAPDLTCTHGTTATPVPATLSAPIYNPTSSYNTNDTVPVSEWLAIANTLTFYHTAAKNPPIADENLFKTGEVYRVTIPLTASNNGLRDASGPDGRLLSWCRNNSASPANDIEDSDGFCDFDDIITPTKLYYTFQVGASTSGAPINVNRATPSDEYTRNSALEMDRNAPRDTSPSVYFDGGVDATSITTGNFELYELTTNLPSLTPGPGYGKCGGGECTTGAIQALPADLVATPSGGNGAYLSYADGRWLKPFTWYKVKVKDFRNLCGTTMLPNPHVWYFETNAVTPGVDYVYPGSGTTYSCPSTPVFVHFNTSMINPLSPGSCAVNQATISNDDSGRSNRPSFETRAALWDGGAYVAGNWAFSDANCQTLVFTPASELVPTHLYQGAVISNRFKDTNGHTIWSGDWPPPALPLIPWNKPDLANPVPWNFSIDAATSCAQQPVVTSVSPNLDANGACVSIQGLFFETPSDSNPGLPDLGDQLALGDYSGPGPWPEAVQAGPPPSTAPIKAWSNSTIVEKVDKGTLAVDQDYHFKVTVNYRAPSTIGPLASNALTLASLFHLKSGTAAGLRPCLYSLSPNQGPPGTVFTAVGENFGNTAGTIRTNNPALSTVWGVAGLPGSWTTSQITGITVPAGANHPFASDVQVRTSPPSPVDSNKVTFTVTNPAPVIPGTVPAVDVNPACALPATIPSPNPNPGDTNACRNTQVNVRFNIPLDPATVTTTTVELFECNNSSCSVLNPMGIQNLATISNIIIFEPVVPLTGGQWYQGQLTTGIKALGSGVPMAAPYTWKFQVRPGTTDCAITALNLQPSTDQITINANYGSYPLATSTADVDCHTVTPPGNIELDWHTTKLTVGRFIPPPPAVASPVTTGPGITTNALMSLNPSAFDSTVTHVEWQSFVSNSFKLTVDPTFCTDNGQCRKTNRSGGVCTQSICVAGHCTPEITSLDPDNGPLKTWMTINGCWFGGFVSGTSSMKFASSVPPGTVEGDLPNPAQCGNASWDNEEIVREVPPSAISGPVSVTSATGGTGTFTGFTLNSNALNPGLCKIVPNFGPRSANVTVTGRGFNNTQAAGDNVIFQEVSTSTDIPVSIYSAWADLNIDGHVPLTASIGDNRVRVKIGAGQTNAKAFTVVAGPACTAPCLTDAQCTVAGEGCSYPTLPSGLGCCAVRPKIISFNPAQGSTLVCRNVIEQVTFDQPLDASTVTANTIRHLEGPNVLSTSLAVANTSSQGTIRVFTPLLSADKYQRLELNTTSGGPLIPVNNPSFEINNIAVSWPNHSSLSSFSQSSNVPPLHTGNSVLVDCYNGCPGNQAYVAQEIPNTNTKGKTYLVQGWISAEVKNNLASGSGFITRCHSGPQNCGFDHLDLAPGLFKNSNGWKRWEMIVTKATNDAINMQLNCFAYVGARAYCDDVTVQEIVSGSTAIRGKTGVLADTSLAPLQYKTWNNSCQLSGININPSFHRMTTLGQVDSFYAEGVSQDGTPIGPTPGSYEWTWGWSSDAPTIASAGMTFPAPAVSNSSYSDADITALSNGQAKMSATATIKIDTANSTVGNKVTGQSDVKVHFCVNPWTFIDSTTNCDTFGGATCSNNNFSLSYCADTAGAPLPLFNYPGTNAASPIGSIEGTNVAADPTRLKSFFFKESATSRDTIGVLIFKNDEILSPLDWFKQRFPLDSGAASTVIDGYPAVKTGTTTYIGVTNLQGGTLQGLMFVFDYNSNNANPETVNIYNQLLDSLVFNYTTNSLTKGQIIRDTKRRQDLKSIQLSLASYKTSHSSYPTLASGSYISGLSTSKWPSWQSALGADLTKTLPVDPINTFTTQCTAPYEAATCWAETDKKFTCPADSKIYGYRNLNGTVDVYATMEYLGPGTFFTGTKPSGLCPAPSPSLCDCFNYALHIAP